ncbi:MAG: hypothetical protein Q8R21_04105 [Burkholderiales bacterium]|nr:hypothetical protein [Burkholderiales bacterium]
MRVAETIGADAFLALWRIADSDPAFRAGGAMERGYLQLRLRPWRSWERFQRNRYIETLAASGMSPSDIQAAVKLNLLEHISERHISTLMKRRSGGAAKSIRKDGDDDGGSQ